MACELVLQPTGGGDSGGQWFMSVPGLGGAKYIGVSLVSGGPYTYGSFGSNSPLSAPGNDTLYLDMSMITYPGSDTTMTFIYIVGGGTPPSGCSDPCMDCALRLITIRHVPPEPTDQEFCETDPDPYNLFVLAGLACSTYSIAYSSGSPTDPGFNLTGGCPGTRGDFIPLGIAPGVYSFDFTRLYGENCDDCTVNMQVTISPEPDPGDDTAGSVCL